MKVDVDQLTGPGEIMDMQHKQLLGTLLDLSQMVATKSYTKEDIDNYARRLEGLIDDDQDEEEEGS